MPQISNLRLLFSSATNNHAITGISLKPKSPFSSFFPSFTPRTPFSLQPITNRKLPLLFAPCASYPKKHWSRNSKSQPNFNVKRRNNSSLTGSNRKGEKGGLAMELDGSSSANSGFNRKRAEGGDKNDRPKNLQHKVRKLNPVNTICYFQILGTGMDTQDTSPSVLLFFDKQRFIFNAGEGLQRFCTEHKIKLSKIDHIFLSRVCSETAGGLPGLLLTLAGIGEEGMSVNVWGPSDLQYLVHAMKSFIPNAAMVHTRSFGPASDSTAAAAAAAPATAKFDEPLVLIDDEVVKLSAVILRPRCSALKDLKGQSLISSFGPTETETHMLENLSSQPSGSGPIAEPTSKPGDLAVIYICELPEIKGKFDPQKAVALGLRPGPKYRELQLGNSVKSDRQNIMVHPNDVLGPSIPGPIVLLVDCPTLSHLKELLCVESLTAYYAVSSDKSAHTSNHVNCVIHLSPSHITNTTEYQKWMSKFGDVQHIMAGHEMKNIEVPILKSSARITARLNYLCPQFFPAPGFWSLQDVKQLPAGSRVSSEGPQLSLCQSIPAENLLKFHLRPYAQLGLDRTTVPDMTSYEDIINELLAEIPEVKEASQHVSQLWLGDDKLHNGTIGQANEVISEEPWLHDHALPSCLVDGTREDMEIVLLGTGSSQPSKYRNVSSIFINLFSKGGILFDCGEGTLGQLKRRFGVEGADDAIRGLRCIWISHIHADHHTGLARILALRCDLLKGVPHEPLVVVGPRQLKRFLDAYQRLENLDMQFLDCWHTTEASLDSFVLKEDNSVPRSPIDTQNVKDENPIRVVDKKINSTLFAKGSRMESYWKRPGSPTEDTAFRVLKTLMKALREAGLEALTSFPVIHCPQAFGVAIKAADRINSNGKAIQGWKIVYSGDTRPCPELVKASRGATVLIHEATFEDGLVEEAISRNHSTTSEAIESGDSAGAYRIILTHFSQRYPKIPVFDETHMHKTCIAFDMMSVNLADLPKLPRVLPHLKILFGDEMVVDDSDDINSAIAVA